MRENPNNGEDRQRGHNPHSGKIERLAIRAHVPLDQNPAGSAAEQIHQQHGNIRQYREPLERAAD